MIKLFNFRPIVFIALSFMGGIFFSVYSQIGVGAIIMPLVIIFILSLICSDFGRNYVIVYYGVIFSLVFILGFFYFYHTVADSSGIIDANVMYQIEGTVGGVTCYNDGLMELIIENPVIDGKELEEYTIRVFTHSEGVRRKEIVAFCCFLEEIPLCPENIENIYTKTCLAAVGETSVTVIGDGAALFDKTARLVSERFSEILPSEQAGIMTALILGDTSNIDREILAEYRMAGIAHIFAVSGLHIGFFCSMLSFILDKLGLKRMLNTVLVCIVCVFYVGMCGFSVSAIRALIMYGIYNFAKCFGKKYDMLNSVFLSMLIVLAVNPQDLFSYGFLLSYSAVISIALFTGRFKNLFKKLPEKLAVKIAVSMAVTLGTLPCLIVMLGEASAFTVIINVLILPVVSVIYYFTLAGAVLAAIFPHLNAFLAIANAAVYFLNQVMLSIGFERFLLKFDADRILLIPYVVNLILLSDKVNLSDRALKYAYLFLPVTLLLLL